VPKIIPATAGHPSWVLFGLTSYAQRKVKSAAAVGWEMDGIGKG